MIFLGGGGSTDQEANVLKKAFLPGQRVVIWPWAQPEQSHQGCIGWLTAALASLGDFPPVQIAKGPDFGLDSSDVIAIPGGNTFTLLSMMQEHGLLAKARDYLQSGGRIYGGSAGAVILGKDIRIIDAALGGLDDNDIGLEDTAALDLLSGFSVYPHFESGDASIVQYCQKHADEYKEPVLAVAETGGLCVRSAEEAINLGPSDIWLFSPTGTRHIWKEGEILDLGSHFSTP